MREKRERVDVSNVPPRVSAWDRAKVYVPPVDNTPPRRNASTCQPDPRSAPAPPVEPVVFYDDARELPEPPYPSRRRAQVVSAHPCRLDHDWPAIDAAMSAAGWPVPANGDSVKRSVRIDEEEGK